MPKARSMESNTQEDEVIATAFIAQGNNASAGASQDGVPGPLIPRGLIGNGNPAILGLKSPPSFNDKKENWVKYKEDLRLHLCEQFGDVDLMTSTFDKIRNRQIYHMIVRGVGTLSFNLIRIMYKDQGQQAFKFLDNHFLGSVESRKARAISKMNTISKLPNENMAIYIARMQELQEELIQFDLMKRTDPGEANMLVGQIINKLVEHKQYEHLHRRLTDRNIREGYPDLTELCKLLSDEEYFIKLQENQTHSHSSVNATRSSTDDTGNCSRGGSISRGQPRRRGNNNRGGRHRSPTRAPDAAAAGNHRQENTAATNVGIYHNINATTESNYSSNYRGGARGRSVQPSGRPRHMPVNQRNHPYKNPRPPISCERCLSRNKKHTAKNCPSIRWCNTCQNASHDGSQCYKNSA